MSSNKGLWMWVKLLLTSTISRQLTHSCTFIELLSLNCTFFSPEHMRMSLLIHRSVYEQQHKVRMWVKLLLTSIIARQFTHALTHSLTHSLTLVFRWNCILCIVPPAPMFYRSWHQSHLHPLKSLLSAFFPAFLFHCSFHLVSTSPLLVVELFIGCEYHPLQIQK